MQYISLELYRAKFSCDDIDDEPDLLIEEAINEAECYVETIVQQAGYVVPLSAKQALFLRSCFLDYARYIWANTEARCTSQILKRKDACLSLLADIKDKECLLPEDSASNAACFQAVTLCRA